MFKIISGFFGWVFSPILSLLDFPVLPAEVTQVIQTGIGYISAGLGILNWFVPINLITPAVAVFAACWAIEHGYTLVMWVLRKIPFVGVQ